MDRGLREDRSSRADSDFATKSKYPIAGVIKRRDNQWQGADNTLLYFPSIDHHRLLGCRTSDLTSISSGIPCAHPLEALPSTTDVSPTLCRPGPCRSARRCLH